MIRHCLECRQTYFHPTQRLCPSCLKQRSDQYQVLEAYLRKHPTATVKAIAEETNVPVKTIRAYIDDHNITVVSQGQLTPCKACSTPIVFGWLCDDCRAKLAASLQPKRTDVH